MKVYEFHQFVTVEKGPVNAAIIDLLQGDIFLAPGECIEKFEKRQYTEISDIISFFKKENLIIEVEEGTWIPRIDLTNPSKEKYPPLILEVEEGLSVDLLISFITEIKDNISKIHYYGSQGFEPKIHGVTVERMEKNFQACIEISMVDENFSKVEEAFYRFNMQYNSCWGKRIAVTRDGKIRPCIYSEMVLGDIQKEKPLEILKIARKLRKITKDRVKICQDCELRYVCFDCREIAGRKGGDLFSPNPNCNYNPYKGTMV